MMPAFGPPRMDKEIQSGATTLERELHAAGYDFLVEERPNFAILISHSTQLLVLDATRRQWIVQAARRCGYSHVALEVQVSFGADAPDLRGDHTP